MRDKSQNEKRFLVKTRVKSGEVYSSKNKSLIMLTYSNINRIIHNRYKTHINKTFFTNSGHIRFCTVLAYLAMVTFAYCSNVEELSFLEKNPELKARLLQWEQDAPDKVKRIAKRPISGNDALQLSEIGPDAKGATLALIEASDDKFPLKLTTIRYPGRREISSSDTTLSEIACKALASIGDPAVQPLVAALTDARSDIRRHAARALGKIAERKKFEVRAADVKAFHKAYMSDRNKLIAEIESNKGKQEEILEEFTKNRRNKLIAQSESRKSKQEEVLKEITTYAVDPLINALHDRDASVRKAVATSLAKISDERCVNPLIDALKDADVSVREIAVEALAEIRDGRPNEALITCLRDESLSVRSAAARTLAITENEKMIEPLITLLNDKDWLVRETALKCWRSVGSDRSPTFKSLIIPLENSQGLTEEVKSEKIRILRSLIRWFEYDVYPEDEVTREAIPRIQAEDKYTLGLASTMLRSGRGYHQVKEIDSFARSKAAELLGSIGNKRAVDSLITSLKDESSTVRNNASEALKKITEKDFGEDYDKWLQWWQEENKNNK